MWRWLTYDPIALPMAMVILFIFGTVIRYHHCVAHAWKVACGSVPDLSNYGHFFIHVVHLLRSGLGSNSICICTYLNSISHNIVYLYLNWKMKSPFIWLFTCIWMENCIWIDLTNKLQIDPYFKYFKYTQIFVRVSCFLFEKTKSL